MTVRLFSPYGLTLRVPFHHVATGTRHVHVAGETARDRAEAPLAPDDPTGQVAHSLPGAALDLNAAGAGFADVVRLTLYVVNWTPDTTRTSMAGIGQVADELTLPGPLPPTSLIGTASLCKPGVLVEIRATTVVWQPSPGRSVPIAQRSAQLPRQ